MYSEEQISDALQKCCTDKEAQIIKARFGIGQTSCTIEEIKMSYMITIDELKKIEAKLLRFLKKN